jgi:aminoglycoside 6'-N-acetyltransferase
MSGLNISTMLNLRTATIADLEMLRQWDRQAHTVPGESDDWAWETELLRKPPWREQLIAELDGRPIGFVQIIDPAEEETHYWGAVPPNLRAIDIWIGMAEDLGRGYGTLMMQQALARCFANPRVAAVLLDPQESNIQALRFYERLGFKRVERRQLGEEDCWVCRLDRPAWEQYNQGLADGEKSL